ncbi:hypothetical protein CANARDRAFT_153841 [[Candida] arabinofermentans NRRL YB-2248]|uniref:Uncharacterized protein n=1 Tax=[Candida] arabinofermentans NRRL YB-2248 TaxID=983967 RepID=A0A1E4T1C5_9ASCO|nr:hypothetical protein CANARDRAFT_153841 [[Candida] arabinofermentans NRRL YB-2248]
MWYVLAIAKRTEATGVLKGQISPLQFRHLRAQVMMLPAKILRDVLICAALLLPRIRKTCLSKSPPNGLIYEFFLNLYR